MSKGWIGCYGCPNTVGKNSEGPDMLNGMMLLWFLLTAVFVAFVAIDIWRKPESRVLKIGFVLFTLYTGPIGAVLYVWGCREPLSGLHEQYAGVRWRQALGSTMQCVAGDGAGILVGAVVAPSLRLHGMAEVGFEYALGFLFGWSIFRGQFRYEIAGGTYLRALQSTFAPELLSINLLMAATVPMMRLMMFVAPQSQEPLHPAFWFIMSIALLLGFIATYPMNWWLVGHHMNLGRMTVRPSADEATAAVRSSRVPASEIASSEDTTTGQILGMTALSFLALSGGLAIVTLFGL